MAFIEFREILWIIICVIIFTCFAIIYYFKIRKMKHHTHKISTSLILNKIIKKKSKKDKIITILLLFSIFFLFIALADPMMRLSGQKEGVNLVLVIDSSGSMQATDFKPNRIESAKESATELISQMSVKDKIGVVGFSDSTRIVSFLSNDKEQVIDKIKTIVANGGTAIGDGLTMGVEMVTSIANKKKLILLLSDGEQTAGQISIPDSLIYAKSKEVIVYTIGVGSNSDTVIGYDWYGNPQYAKLDEESLKKIAQETGGQYFRAIDELNLKEIYTKLPELIKKEKELQSIKNQCIFLSLILLLSSFIVKYHKKIKIW